MHDGNPRNAAPDAAGGSAEDGPLQRQINNAVGAEETGLQRATREAYDLQETLDEVKRRQDKEDAAKKK